MKILGMSKEMSRGVFWVIDGELLAFPYVSGTLGGVAKSGNTYNHKRLWDDVKPRGCNKPYNYYPRGRVDITNKGIPIIYINPNIDEDIIKQVRTEFGLRADPIVREDWSEHYKCYMDDGWNPDR